MAKRPTIETLDVGYTEKYKLNQNLVAIATKFDEMLSRNTVTDTPNFMETDLDVADATITNTTRLDLEVLIVGTTTFTALSDYYIYRLSQLQCDTPGAILVHDAEGLPECLHPGSNGQVLKVSGNTAIWAEDIDTDTDTVGVTVQEDGVTVAENVTTIDFLWTPSVLVTTPSSDQVDLTLGNLLVALWEDTRSTNDLNIKPDGPSAVAFNGGASQVTRVDLVSTVGIGVPATDDALFVIMEASSKLISNGTPDAGTWTQGVRFYDATGNSTPLTGVQIPATGTGTEFITNGTAGGALMTCYAGIPAGTRYVDFAKGDAWLFPLFITEATIDNRYRAILTANVKNGGFTSPNGVAFPGGVNPSVTP